MNGVTLMLTIIGGIVVVTIFGCGIWQIMDWIVDYQTRLDREKK